MRLATLLLKESTQFFRDRLLLALTLYFYTACVIICASALSFDVTNLPMAFHDEDGSSASRALRRALENNTGFDVLPARLTEGEAVRALERGEASIAVLVPRGFERRLDRGETATVQVWLDGTNANSAAAAKGYLEGIARQVGAQWSAASEEGPPTRAAVRVWYNPEQSTTPFMVLSMIALAGMLVGVILPAASIVREKERGTIEQLMVTPIRIGELFLAKTVPTLAMGLLSLFISLSIVALFDVPLRGSLVFLWFATAAFLLSAIALGVLTAAVSRTLQQALLLAFFGLFPIMFLSGTLSPLESMPVFLQRISLLSPLRYYMEILLGVFLKGAGWFELWQEVLAMLAIGTVLFGLSGSVFRRSLD